MPDYGRPPTEPECRRGPLRADRAVAPEIAEPEVGPRLIAERIVERETVVERVWLVPAKKECA